MGAFICCVVFLLFARINVVVSASLEHIAWSAIIAWIIPLPIQLFSKSHILLSDEYVSKYLTEVQKINNLYCQNFYNSFYSWYNNKRFEIKLTTEKSTIVDFYRAILSAYESCLWSAECMPNDELITSIFSPANMKNSYCDKFSISMKDLLAITLINRSYALMLYGATKNTDLRASNISREGIRTLYELSLKPITEINHTLYQRFVQTTRRFKHEHSYTAPSLRNGKNYLQILDAYVSIIKEIDQIKPSKRTEHAKNLTYRSLLPLYENAIIQTSNCCRIIEFKFDAEPNLESDTLCVLLKHNFSSLQALKHKLRSVKFSSEIYKLIEADTLSNQNIDFEEIGEKFPGLKHNNLMIVALSITNQIASAVNTFDTSIFCETMKEVLPFLKKMHMQKYEHSYLANAMLLYKFLNGESTKISLTEQSLTLALKEKDVGRKLEAYRSAAGFSILEQLPNKYRDILHSVRREYSQSSTTLITRSRAIYKATKCPLYLIGIDSVFPIMSLIEDCIPSPVDQVTLSHFIADN